MEVDHLLMVAINALDCETRLLPIPAHFGSHTVIVAPGQQAAIVGLLGASALSQHL